MLRRGQAPLHAMALDAPLLITLMTRIETPQAPVYSILLQLSPAS